MVSRSRRASRCHPARLTRISPAGATLVNGSVVSDTQPVFPGDAHVMHVAFSLPYSDSMSLAITQPVDYPLKGQVEVLVQPGAMSVDGDGFSQLGTRQLGIDATLSATAALSISRRARR